MSDIKIIDDFLPEKEYRTIYQYFVDSEFGYEGQSCPWYWVDGTSYFDDGYYMFVNLCYGNYTITNPTMFNLLLPFTANFDPAQCVMLFALIYCTGTYGGAITAILFNIPGAPENAPTAFD